MTCRHLTHEEQQESGLHLECQFAAIQFRVLFFWDMTLRSQDKRIPTFRMNVLPSASTVTISQDFLDLIILKDEGTRFPRNVPIGLFSDAASSLNKQELLPVKLLKIAIKCPINAAIFYLFPTLYFLFYFRYTELISLSTITCITIGGIKYIETTFILNISL